MSDESDGFDRDQHHDDAFVHVHDHGEVHVGHPADAHEPVVYEEPFFTDGDQESDEWPDAPDETTAWHAEDDTEPAEPTDLAAADERRDGDIVLRHDGDDLAPGPLDAPTSHDVGDAPIRLSDDLGGLLDGEPFPPGIIEDPSWDLVPEDNGGLGAAVMGLAAAGAVAGVLRADRWAGLPRPVEAQDAVTVFEGLGAPARLEHGDLSVLRRCVDSGGTVLLTGTDSGGGRVPLALVDFNDARGVLVLHPAEGPPAPVEVSVAAFQQAWDDTAAQMVVAGDDGRTLLLPVTVAPGPAR